MDPSKPIVPWWRPRPLLLPHVAASDDELGGGFVLPGLLALGGKSPGRDRMAATRSASLAASVRMVDRIHRHAAAMHEALLGGIETQDDVFAVAADDLRIGSRRTRNLSTLADLDLDVMDDGADRNVSRRHCISGLYIHVLARHHRIARGKALRRQDVGTLAVLVLDKRDEAGAVGVIFDALDLCRHIELAPLEIDAAISPFVAAAAKPHRDTAIVVAAAAGSLARCQGFDWGSAVQSGAIDQHELALARRDRIICLESHGAASQSRRHIDAVALFEGYDRTLDFRLLADRSPDRLDLAFANMGVDALHLDIEELLHRFLDLRLGGVPGDLEHHLVLFRSHGRLLGDHRRENKVIVTRIGCGHFSRASNASSAFLVNTSVWRRRMS